jgi:aminopeptidase N
MVHLSLKRLAIGACFVFVCAGPAAAEAPFHFDTTPGRLPKTVIPTDYTVSIVPRIKAHTFTGSESVVLKVTKPTRTIVFNTLDMTISSARLDGKPARVRTNNTAQLSTVTLASPMAIGTHTLALVYAGKIQRSAEGLFYQPYRTPAGKTKEMLGTQMESTDARRMFPGWDEPAFRATFKLTVTLPADYAAVSNTPVESAVTKGALKTTTFVRTPKMASYLVVLCAGNLESISGSQDGVKISVWTTEGKKERGRYALESAKKILAYYDDYFGIKFPLPKLDLIAIPGGFGGAMENWGGITFNEQILLFDPSTAAIAQKEDVFSVEAHEMAHQWFGDLVTMAWWDNLWLNEGFASWMGTKSTDHFNPSWHAWQGALGEKSQAMDSDARVTTHPIQQKIDNETEAAAAFDDITYLKGQSFLRMLESYIGEVPFRTGIRSYIAAHKYSSSTTADLWNALAASSGKPVAAIARAWTERPGFPLVTATATCTNGVRSFALAQQRFLLSGTASAGAMWDIPVGIAPAPATGPYTFMQSATTTVAPSACDVPISLNAQDIGFYRVQYDAATEATNLKNFSSFTVENRIGMLDDTWALVQAGRAQAPAYLKLAAAVGADADETEWNGITDALGAMDRLETGKPGDEAFLAYTRQLVRPVFMKLGWDTKLGDSESTQQLRQRIIGALGSAGDKTIIAEAQKRFTKFLANSKTLTPTQQSVIANIVGKYADQATFNQLHKLAKSAATIEERQRFYSAMAGAKDDALANQVLALTISGEFPPEIASNRVGIVQRVAGAGHAKRAWEFYKANRAALYSSLSVFEVVLGIAQAPEAFWNAAPTADLEAYVRKSVPAAAAPQVAKAIERVKFRKQLQARLVPQIDSYLASTAK